MIEFVLGVAVGAALAVWSPVVFRFTAEQVARLKDKFGG